MHCQYKSYEMATDFHCQKHEKSGVQVALKWIIQNGVTLTTKSTNKDHLATDLDIFNWQLTAAEMTALNEANKPSGTPSFTCSN